MSLEYFFGDHFSKHAATLGIEGVKDVLLYLPKKYIDYTKVDTSLQEVAEEGRSGIFRVRVNKISKNYQSRPPRVTAYVTDGKISFTASCFGATQSWSDIKNGDVIYVKGKVGEYRGMPQLESAEVVPEYMMGKIYSEYKGVKGKLSSSQVATAVSKAVTDHLDVGRMFIESYLDEPESAFVPRTIPEFGSISALLMALHRPESMDQAEAALRGAARLNVYAVMLAASKVGKKVFSEKSMIPVDFSKIKELVGQLEFTLTDDQRKCIFDICNDLSSAHTMDRVVSGDVGCGKTLAYGIPGAYANMFGKRVIILVPNMMLAHQIYHEITTTFPGVRAVLATDGSPVSSVTDEMIIGTTAILGVVKRNPHYVPDLLIVDEQQKFSSEQKNVLLAPHTNLLQASATPMPKTMGEIVFGNKDVSYMEQSPVEKSIRSYVVTKEDKARVMRKLMEMAVSPDKISILYPLKEYSKRAFVFTFKSEELHKDLKKQIQKAKGKSVTKPEADPAGGFFKSRFTLDSDKCTERLALIRQISGIESVYEVVSEEADKARQKTVESSAQVWEKHLPNQVVSVHGGMSVADKLHAVETAKGDSCRAIVTSSVVEIGLTFPGLKGMLVVDADKHGASTLHQIRGRLVRKGGEGLFFMLVDKPKSEIPKETMDRLKILVKCTKGSEVAYEDMLQRGFGDLLNEDGLQNGHLHTIFPGIKIKPQDILSLRPKSA